MGKETGEAVLGTNLLALLVLATALSVRDIASALGYKISAFPFPYGGSTSTMRSPFYLPSLQPFFFRTQDALLYVP